MVRQVRLHHVKLDTVICYVGHVVLDNFTTAKSLLVEHLMRMSDDDPRAVMHLSLSITL